MGKVCASGGVGTLRLPRGPDGSRLVTLTTTLNVSAGMPALISSDIWERYNLSEGCIVRGLKAIWREMDEHWSKQFPTVRGIPRGYFVLEPSTGINIKSRNSPLNIHPFTVMEYWNGSTQWLDYVYATADTSERGYRNKLEEFFEQYRHADDRQGQYLLASDTYEPMWDALFNSPEEMRRAKSAQLRLIEARIHDALSGEDVIQALAKAVSSLPGVTVTDLRRLSQDAGVDPRRWLEGGSLAGEISRLVNEAVQSGKQHALLQAVLIEGSPTPPDPFD